MKVLAAWHGGNSYSHPSVDDIESFDSIEAAKKEFRRRRHGHDSYYPLVDNDSYMLIFLAESHPYSTELKSLDNPDYILTFTERGTVNEAIV